MIYLDYSATTPVSFEVLDTFNRTTKDFIGNPNSLHKLGVKSQELISSATKVLLFKISFCKFSNLFLLSSLILVIVTFFFDPLARKILLGNTYLVLILFF